MNTKHVSIAALALLATAAIAPTASAADLAPPPPPPPAPEIRPTMTDWTGPYLGAVAGGTCMEADTTITVHDNTGRGTDTTTDPALNGCGFSGGFVYGFNYQLDQAVIGIEGDFVWGSDKVGEHYDYTAAGDRIGENYNIDWMTTVRARAGWLMNNDTLAYVTGGVAWTRAGLEDILTGQEITKTNTGFVVGGGLEHAFTENLHLRAEYLFYGFKDKNYGPYTCPAGSGCDPNGDGDDGATVNASTNIKAIHSFRVGVTWNFPVSTW